MCPRGSCPGTAFSGPMSRFRRFSVCVSCPRCWSSFCCNFPGFRGLAEVVLEASCRLKPARGFPPGWHEEKAGMCFQTRIFDPSFWRGEAGQVETQMDPADPISLWWQRIGKVRAVRQWGVKNPLTLIEQESGGFESVTSAGLGALPWWDTWFWKSWGEPTVMMGWEWYNWNWSDVQCFC